MLKILTLSLFLGSANVASTPYDYFSEVGLSSEFYDLSKTIERVNGTQFAGSRFFVRSGSDLSFQFELFDRESKDINYMSVKSVYKSIGYEFISERNDGFKDDHRHLMWVGYNFHKGNSNLRVSYSTDLAGFSKSIVNLKLNGINYKGLTLSPKFESSKVGNKNWWQMQMVAELQL